MKAPFRSTRRSLRAARRRKGELLKPAVAGSEACCPRCLSRCVVTEETPRQFGIYARRLSVCGDCRAVWEPVDASDLVDPADRHSATRHPCNNCAFRKDSPERRDPELWAGVMRNVKQLGGFFCHKGVPIDPQTEHGFLYPHTPSGEVDVARNRFCAGWLKAASSELGKMAGVGKGCNKESGAP